MSIKVSSMGTQPGQLPEQNRLVKEFKGYLRKKIGLDKLEKAEKDHV